MCIMQYAIFLSTYPIIHLFLQPSMLQSWPIGLLKF